ncbi:MAG: hypothetical protein AB1806_08355 [Acidobacteriota bacterium]
MTAQQAGIGALYASNRHQMAPRWVETLKGRKHLRLGGDETT